jgi:anti-anti-sigma factor
MEGFTITFTDPYTIVEFYDTSLMDPVKLEELSKKLFHLVDAEDRRWVILDFNRVHYISSQFIGILLGLHKRLNDLPKSKLILCGVGPRLQELLRITRLDKLFNIRPTQREAVL